ncbi:type II toxin-antitoxin system RelE/ParE family toxin [Blastopirellula sp. J2-11]|uniref:type II toxin-antitoxin system RelE/ParE family toxin n=1 Tax=Blastopirellula sp. J2-11 TaxID=2943192 RepID=UPI0021C92FD2|nr:type II toxin-antitoxin system RelE/ParE family toxin [Blastopirellula sp. J2-11]UUO06966.1 type II toxin-antitoxin system RelE/ParE family toxin [Blastopirellula sp. J2-11]
MSARVFWDVRAQNDLAMIVDYIAFDQQSPQNDELLLDMIQNKIELYATSPLLGEIRNDLGPELRIFSVHSIVVVYAVIPSGIVIERVIHAARDFPRLFGK